MHDLTLVMHSYGAFEVAEPSGAYIDCVWALQQGCMFCTDVPVAWSGVVWRPTVQSILYSTSTVHAHARLPCKIVRQHTPNGLCPVIALPLSPHLIITVRY